MPGGRGRRRRPRRLAGAAPDKSKSEARERGPRPGQHRGPYVTRSAMVSGYLCLQRVAAGARPSAAAPMATRLSPWRIGIRRGFASGEASSAHWSKDKAKVNGIKQYGTYATIGVFVAGVGWRGYQWYVSRNARVCTILFRALSLGHWAVTRWHLLRRATGSMAGQQKAAAPPSVPTEEALAAATKKSVVHWEGTERPPVVRGEPATAATAAAAPSATDDDATAAAAMHEADPPDGSAKAMKLAHDVQAISARLGRVEKALGVPEQQTVTHVVLLKLKKEATAAQKTAIIDGLRALPSQIPEIAAYRCGVDLGLDPSEQDIAIVGEFQSVADYQAYAKHPAHTGLIVSKIKPLLATRTAVQFEHGEAETYATGTKCGVTHVVILKLADKSAVPAIIERARTLPGKISQIQEYRCGYDLGIDPCGATLAIVGSFKCKGCYGGYAKNADHQALIQDLIKPALAPGGRAAAQFNIEL
jgi:hypothetical protein